MRSLGCLSITEPKPNREIPVDDGNDNNNINNDNDKKQL